jgi:hypothetical protein
VKAVRNFDEDHLAEFMERAQNAIVDTGLLGINRTKLDNVETIMRCFDLESAEAVESGYRVPVKDRDCAVRLLEAGLLDQTADEIEQRWGPVVPSIPWETDERDRDGEETARP